MKKRLWISLAVTLVVAVIVGIFFAIRSAMVEKEERLYVGFHGQARLNPFLAAQRVLERLETSARSRPGFPDSSALLQSEDPTDCVVASLSSLPDKVLPIQSLREWLNRGGVLITGPTGGRHSQPKILPPELKQLLGVHSFVQERKGGRKVPFPPPDSTGVKPEKDEDGDKAGAPKPKKKNKPAEEELDEDFASIFEQEISLQLPGEDVSLKVSSRSVWRIKPSPTAQTLDTLKRDTAFAIAQEVGDGLVILISDLDLLDNHNLRNGANSTFLHHLTSEASDVTFVYGWDSPTLSAYLWDEQRPTLAALLALLVIGLVTAASRFGPLQAPPQPLRRELLEHIRAAGLNLFRHAGRGSLAIALRRRIRARATLIHPAWNGLGDEDIARELARYAGFDADKVVRAMTAPVISREELVEFSATLHLLRQSLGPNR